MKRIFIFLLTAMLFIAADSSLAVDKKKTDPKAKTKTTKVDVKKKPAAKAVVTKPKQATTKKVDKFVDKNNNGIDDRREKLRSKTVSKKKPAATKVDPKKTVKTKVVKKTTKKPVVKKKN